MKKSNQQNLAASLTENSIIQDSIESFNKMKILGNDKLFSHEARKQIKVLFKIKKKNYEDHYNSILGATSPTLEKYIKDESCTGSNLFL